MLVFKLYVFHMFNLCFDVYYYGLWIYIIASFIRFDHSVRWFRFLENVVSPPLRWIQKLTGGRTQFGMFDFSPLILVMVLPFLKQLLAWALGLGA